MKKHSRTLVLLIATLLFSMAWGATGVGAKGRQPERTKKIFVDTDIGIDDAVAIAYLLKAREANVIGFTTVAGNTSVDNATRNLLTLLDVMNVSKPITVGAAAPLAFPASHVGGFVHGPDGFWFAQAPHDISGLPHDAPAAIAAAAQANPDMTLIALGPLTNVALAVQQYPANMAGLHVIAISGAQKGGNRTPIAETNAFNDPHALEIVLNSDVDLTLITLDAFDKVEVDSKGFTRALQSRGGATGNFLAAILGPYVQSLTGGQGGKVEIPDAAAALYALEPNLGTAAPGLVHVIVDGGQTRGLTIMSTDPGVKVAMIADDTELSALVDQFFTDPNFNLLVAMGAILARDPDNAELVLDVSGHAMARLLERGLTR